MRKPARASETDNVTAITFTGKGRKLAVPLRPLKDIVLGKRYRLSVVFAPQKLMRKLNRTYRGEDKIADILSFPLSKRAGEIFISETAARRAASERKTTMKNYLGYLIIHGVLHLKGFRHGSKMERKERALCKKFRQVKIY